MHDWPGCRLLSRAPCPTLPRAARAHEWDERDVMGVARGIIALK